MRPAHAGDHSIVVGATLAASLWTQRCPCPPWAPCDRSHCGLRAPSSPKGPTERQWPSESEEAQQIPPAFKNATSKVRQSTLDLPGLELLG